MIRPKVHDSGDQKAKGTKKKRVIKRRLKFEDLQNMPTKQQNYIKITTKI